MSISFGSKTKYPDSRFTVFRPTQKTTASGKNYVQADLSTGRKTGRKTEDGRDEYRNSSWRASFYGNAAQKFNSLGIGEKDVITITDGAIENRYVKETQKSYTDVTVYDFERWQGNSNGAGAPQHSAPAGGQNPQYGAPVGGDGFMNIPNGIDEELPFN